MWPVGYGYMTAKEWSNSERAFQKAILIDVSLGTPNVALIKKRTFYADTYWNDRLYDSCALRASVVAKWRR